MLLLSLMTTLICAAAANKTESTEELTAINIEPTGRLVATQISRKTHHLLEENERLKSENAKFLVWKEEMVKENERLKSKNVELLTWKERMVEENGTLKLESAKVPALQKQVGQLEVIAKELEIYKKALDLYRELFDAARAYIFTEDQKSRMQFLSWVEGVPSDQIEQVADEHIERWKKSSTSESEGPTKAESKDTTLKGHAYAVARILASMSTGRKEESE